jgi:spore maturation protein CgeB
VLVVMIAHFAPGRLGRYVADGFRALGHQVVEVDDRGLVRGSRFARGIARLAKVGPPAAAETALVDQATASRADLILVIKGAYLSEAGVRRLRRKGTVLVNWMPDDPFVRMRPAVPLKAMRHYDSVVTYSERVAQRLPELDARPVIVPFGFAEDDYVFPPRDMSPRFDVAFVGAYRRHRLRLVRRIQDCGFSVRVAGPGWETWAARSLGSGEPAPYGADACAVYHSARVGLNVLHPANNVGSHNMRTFEIPASGRAMLTTETEQQKVLLTGIDGVAYYSGEDDIANAARDLLERGEHPVDRDLLRRHTYTQRCEALIAELG